MPRSIDVVLRDAIVDSAKPGDKCCFVGALAVVPDVASLIKPGERQTVAQKTDASRRPPDGGLSGLKQLGVRDLNYRLVFIASHVGSLNSYQQQ